MTSFETKGELPQWQLIADYMRSLDAGQVATFVELALIADSKPELVSNVISQVNLKLYREGFRLVAVRGVGYRVATPADALYESTVVRAFKFRRQARRAQQAAIAAARNPEATPWQKAQAEQAALHWRERRLQASRDDDALRKYRPERPRVRTSNDDL